ncbi:hypothetical protein N7461_002969 [Penicillium sp. DV-2018c]|nr:hypothetical protein N7461_002969 [Penicillium sp. DV-2018c]
MHHAKAGAPEPRELGSLLIRSEASTTPHQNDRTVNTACQNHTLAFGQNGSRDARPATPNGIFAGQWKLIQDWALKFALSQELIKEQSKIWPLVTHGDPSSINILVCRTTSLAWSSVNLSNSFWVDEIDKCLKPVPEEFQTERIPSSVLLAVNAVKVSSSSTA